jgi:hypothetical protein
MPERTPFYFGSGSGMIIPDPNPQRPKVPDTDPQSCLKLQGCVLYFLDGRGDHVVGLLKKKTT